MYHDMCSCKLQKAACSVGLPLNLRRIPQGSQQARQALKGDINKIYKTRKIAFSLRSIRIRGKINCCLQSQRWAALEGVQHSELQRAHAMLSLTYE